MLILYWIHLNNKTRGIYNECNSKSVSLRKVLVISLSFLTILSMVLNFNFKEAQAQNKTTSQIKH